MNKTVETDVLIIGSGFAGLLAAIKLLESGASVVLGCKTYLSESSTNYA
jgi:succinate dehydrogenase/fumarate reductase flavoprotein subunit